MIIKTSSKKLKPTNKSGMISCVLRKGMLFLIHFHTVSANDYFYYYDNISNGIDAKQNDNKIILINLITG